MTVCAAYGCNTPGLTTGLATFRGDVVMLDGLQEEQPVSNGDAPFTEAALTGKT